MSTLISALIVTFILVISLNGVNATIIQGTPLFNLSSNGFGPGQIIEGFLNFSLNNEPGNTNVKATINPGSVTKTMSLLDFLKLANINFGCNPADCNVTYVKSNPAESKLATLGVGDKYFAVVATGDSVRVINLSFMINGSGSSSMTCGDSPLKLDLLNDGSVDFEYKNPSIISCGNYNAGNCYAAGATHEDALIVSTPYCEKIRLNKTGKVDLGADVMLESGDAGENDVSLSVRDSSGKVLGTCDIDYVDSASYTFKSCTIDSSIEEQKNFFVPSADDYYVCISSKGDANYFIQSESVSPVCGLYGNPPGNLTTDYALYVKVYGFAAFNEAAVLDSDTFINGNLVSYVQDYIDDKYTSNCGTSGCIVPLRFISKNSQQLNISNLNFKFSKTGGVVNSKTFYDVTVNYPKLNMSRQEVQLSALNMSSPMSPGQQYTFSVQLGSLTGSRTFKVEDVPQITSLLPLIAIPNQVTTFRVTATAPGNRQITNYKWNFGDGSGEIVTTEANTTHVYGSGTFTLTVTATDSMGLQGSKSFVIIGNITKEVLNASIDAIIARASSLETKYNTLIEPWYADIIGLDLTNITSRLEELKSEVEGANQDELIAIKQELDTIILPLDIKDSMKLLESSYYVNPDNVEPQFIKDLASSTYNDNLKIQYQNAIALWQQDNVDMKISGAVKTFVYDTGNEDKVTIVNIRLVPKTTVNNVYLVFLLPSAVMDSEVRVNPGSFDRSDLSTAIGFSFASLSSSETITLAIPGKQDLATMNFYVSPKLEQLSVSGSGGTGGKVSSPPIALAVIFIILILIAAAAGLWFLWRGYGSKREKELFKNPVDLYNLMDFISNAERKGTPRKKIEENLKKSGWTSSQINYAWKKLKKQEKGSKEGKEKGMDKLIGLGEPYGKINYKK